MKTYKCDRCGTSFQLEKRLPKGKLRYGKDKLRLCLKCHISYMSWSVSAEVEREREREAERELFIAMGCGNDNSDFNLPAEVTNLKYSYLGEEK